MFVIAVGKSNCYVKTEILRAKGALFFFPVAFLLVKGMVLLTVQDTAESS